MNDILGKGDLVEVIGGKIQGLRGYVLTEPTADDDDQQRMVQLAMRMDGPPDYLPIYDLHRDVASVAVQDVKLLRRVNDFVYTRVCDYTSTHFGRLGTTSETSPLDPESAFDNLHRPSIDELPGPHTVDSIFKDSAVGQLYRDLYHGRNVVLKWCHHIENNEDLVRCPPGLIVTVLLEEETQQQSVASREIMTILRIPEQRRDEHGDYFFSVTVRWNDPRLDGQLMPEQLNALVNRMLHLFIRLAGCDIGPHKAAKGISWGCMQQYIHRGWHKEVLDLKIIHADIFAQSSYGKNLPMELTVVASALEACSMFQEGAAIVGQVLTFAKAEGDVFQLSRIHYPPEGATHLKGSNFTELHLYCMQGEMWTSCREWNKAEESLLYALKSLFSSVAIDLAFKDAIFARAAMHLHELYRAWLSTLPDGADADTVNEVSVLFFALLEMVTLKRSLAYMLEPGLRNPRAAKKALKQAFLSDSVESFRAVVCSWKKADCDIKATSSAIEDFKSVRKAAKAGGRLVQGAGLRSEMTTYCSGCRKQHDQSKLLRCNQCKSVVYCSAACQKAEWKKHRDDCKRIAAQLALKGK